MDTRTQTSVGRRLLFTIGCLIALAVTELPAHRGVAHFKPILAQTENGEWSEPVLVSTNENATSSWFPDVATDGQGRLHIVWDSTGPPRHLGDRGLGLTMHAVRMPDGTWSEPNDIATGSGYEVSRPALALDQMGTLHMAFRPSGVVYYSRADSEKAHSAQAWSNPRCLSRRQNYIPDITVDSNGVIHAIWYEWVPVELSEKEIFRHKRSAYLSDVFYRQSADGGTTWSEPLNLSHTPNAGSGRPQIKIDDQDQIHVVWDEGWDRNAQNDMAGELPVCGMYVHSLDGGRTWSTPKVLDSPLAARTVLTGTYSYYGSSLRRLLDRLGRSHPRYSEALVYQRRLIENVSETRKAQARLEEEREDINVLRVERELHELEIERTGFTDQLSALASPTVGMSFDELCELSASDPRREPVESLPQADNAQITIGLDDNEGVLLMWRSRKLRRLYYTWSEDGGSTWEPVEQVPGIYARPWNEPYDAYTAATDSLGHIHLLVIATTVLPEPDERDVPLGVYHLKWDGKSWAEPDMIAYYPGLAIPEYPRIAVGQGNHLHVVWYLRPQGDWGEDTQIWYSEREINAPPETPLPTSTPTAMPTPTPITTPLPTATPFPTVGHGTSGMPKGLQTESDDVARLLLSLSPVFLIVVTLTIIRRLWRR